MARKLKTKQLSNTRLLKDYASWIYCENCNQTVSYLCYVTYDKVIFHYTCQCGNTGNLLLDFNELKVPSLAETSLLLIKNRRCCPIDQSALITIQEHKLLEYSCEIVCKTCGKTYFEEKHAE